MMHNPPSPQPKKRAGAGVGNRSPPSTHHTSSIVSAQHVPIEYPLHDCKREGQDRRHDHRQFNRYVSLFPLQFLEPVFEYR